MIAQIKGKLKTKELEDGICRLIIRNNLRKGDPILSENKLTEMFGISRVTVRQTLSDLVEKGVLYKVRGKGTFVDSVKSLKPEYSQIGLSKTIALVGGAINNSYFANIARGAEDAARAHDCNMSFCSTDGSPKNEESYINELLKKGIDGIIFSPAESCPFTPFTEKLCRENDNVVIINASAIGLNASSVSSDDREGGYLATKYLIEQGHKKIAHIRGPKLVSNALEREEGYRKALTESGIAINEKLIYGNNTFSKDQGYHGMKAFLELPQEKRPTAVFGASDIMAWGAYEAIKERGLHTPKDIALVGYGDLLETARMGLQLTSVRQNGYEIGKTACEILLDKSSKNGGKRKILIPTELTIRKSSKG